MSEDNGKRIGIRDIARLARVSVGTVDRALNGRSEVSEATRARILKLAKEHNYIPDANARALSRRRSSVRVGVCIPREIRFFYDQLYAGILREADLYRPSDIELNYLPAKALASDEAILVRQLIETGIQALIVTPGNRIELAPLLNEAEIQKNIRVVCVATDDSLSKRSSAVCVEPRMNGMLAAELLAGFVPAKSRVAVFTGTLAAEDHARKVSGFYEVFLENCANGRIVDLVEGYEDEAGTFEKCIDLLHREPQLQGIYVSTANSLPVCRALKETGRAGRVRLITTDLFAEAVPFFYDRTISAAVHQQPYRQGQVAVRLIMQHFLKGAPFPRTSYLNPAIVMRSNLNLFRETASVIAHSMRQDSEPAPSAAHTRKKKK